MFCCHNSGIKSFVIIVFYYTVLTWVTPICFVERTVIIVWHINGVSGVSAKKDTLLLCRYTLRET